MHTIIRAISSVAGWVAGLFGRASTSVCSPVYTDLSSADRIARGGCVTGKIDHFGDHDDQIGQGDG